MPDPLYAQARRALLDALEALRPHLDALVVVGAQAVYLHTGPAELAVAELTTDADLAISPQLLARGPDLGEMLEARGFRHHRGPGSWVTPGGVALDLLVPEALAGPGRRAARLSGHHKRVARRARGLEGVLVENELRDVGALGRRDPRVFTVAVAGPAALLVAKIHKIAERLEQPDRLVDKDALDVLRLLRAVPLPDLVRGTRRLLDSEIAGATADEALELADAFMRRPSQPAPRMAARAAGGLEDPDTIAASMAALYTDLSEALGRKGV